MTSETSLDGEVALHEIPCFSNFLFVCDGDEEWLVTILCDSCLWPEIMSVVFPWIYSNISSFFSS
jgi:hypothetical protein